MRDLVHEIFGRVSDVCPAAVCLSHNLDVFCACCLPHSLPWSVLEQTIWRLRHPRGKQQQQSGSSWRHSWTKPCAMWPSSRRCVTAGSVPTRYGSKTKPYPAMQPPECTSAYSAEFAAISMSASDLARLCLDYCLGCCQQGHLLPIKCTPTGLIRHQRYVRYVANTPLAECTRSCIARQVEASLRVASTLVICICNLLPLDSANVHVLSVVWHVSDMITVLALTRLCPTGPARQGQAVGGSSHCSHCNCRCQYV